MSVTVPMVCGVAKISPAASHVLLASSAVFSPAAVLVTLASVLIIALQR